MMCPISKIFLLVDEGVIDTPIWFNIATPPLPATAMVYRFSSFTYSKAGELSAAMAVVLAAMAEVLVAMSEVLVAIAEVLAAVCILPVFCMVVMAEVLAVMAEVLVAMAKVLVAMSAVSVFTLVSNASMSIEFSTTMSSSIVTSCAVTGVALRLITYIISNIILHLFQIHPSHLETIKK